MEIRKGGSNVQWFDIIFLFFAWPGMILTIYVLTRVISLAIFKSKKTMEKNKR